VEEGQGEEAGAWAVAGVEKEVGGVVGVWRLAGGRVSWMLHA